MPRGSKPGERRGGRKKGTPNKLTDSLKAAIIGALEQQGGTEYLAELARTDKRTFAMLLGRLIPQEGSGRDRPIERDQVGRIEIVIIDPVNS